MMGLGRREARRRLDAVLDFAELREFTDLKLKNYSSGMMVRLAFAVMVEADADIMLVDEVLAVGDAAFAQKCMDVFREKRRAGRTIVLVTHDMATVQGFCDRAMLLHDGELRYLGDPEEAALRYYRLNFGGAGDAEPRGRRRPRRERARASTPGSRTRRGERVENVEQGEPIGLRRRASRRATTLEAPVFGFHFLDADGAPVFGFNRTRGRRAGGRGRRARADRRADREPAAARPLLRRLLDLAQPHPGRPRAARRAAARLRRLRDAGRAGQRARCGRTSRRALEH